MSVTSFLRSAINAKRKAANGGEENPVPIPEFRKELLGAMEDLMVLAGGETGAHAALAGLRKGYPVPSRQVEGL